MKSTVTIKGKDFAEACRRFFNGPSNELFKHEEFPPPSPEVAEILRGLAIGWNQNESRKALVELQKKNKAQ